MYKPPQTPTPLHKCFLRLNFRSKTRTRRFVTAVLYLVMLTISPFIVTTQASAWSGDLSSCGTNDLANWNWPEILVNGGHPLNNEKEPWTGFDPESSSYVIGKGVKNQGSLTIYRAIGNNKVNITKNTSTGLNEITTGGGYLQRATFSENGNGDYADINDYSTFNFTVQQPTPLWGVANAVNPDQNFCIAAVKNVVYDATYTGKQYTTNIGYSVPVEQCDALEFGCWIAKAFKGVSETLLGAAQAILQGVAYLFAPASHQLQQVYTDFTTFFDAKLGFFLYPFEFIINLFNAFGSEASPFCGSSTCALTLPNIHGSSLNIDLLQWRNTAPAIYNILVNAVRGLTVATLIFGIHRKYLEVIQK